MHSGPPDKWTDFQVDGMDDQQVLAKLNDLAKAGFTGQAVTVSCTNGLFVFVAGYDGQQA